MALSSNTIIHFTNSCESLKGILKGNFNLKYCLEKVMLGKDLTYAAPMVSFCDIPLSEVKDHIGKYGSYGLGLTKEWAQKNQLNPVLYLESNSLLSQSIYESYMELNSDENFNWNKISSIQKNLLNILRNIKNYEGDLERKDKLIKNYRFSDEREWRYTPKYDDCKFIAVHKESYSTEEQKVRINNSIRDLRLEFEPNDIKYIIIENDNEISDFLDTLRKSKGKKYSYDDVERLMTRILTTEQILTDF